MALADVRADLFATFNHTSPPIGLDGTPLQAYEALRDAAVDQPIGWSEAHGGYWIVAGYDQCHQIMQDPVTFSNAAVTFPAYQVGDTNRIMLAAMDEPEHKKYRSLVAGSFSPQKAAEYEAALRTVTNRLIDTFIATGQADVAKSVGDDVPGRLTAIMLGLPSDDGDTYRTWVRAMTHLFVTDPAGAAAIIGEMHEYFTAALAERKRHPGDDVLSMLIDTEVEGERLNDSELEAFFIVVLIGGIENSTKLLGTALWRLAWDRELRRRLINRPELITPVIDELLRYYTPAGVGRVVMEDVTVAGVPMKKDQIAFMMLPVANRDASQFPYPDVMIPDRAPNRHLTMGTGIHRCIGIHLQRIETRVVLSEFLKRVPEFELDPSKPSKWTSGQVTGMGEVPILFPAGEPQGA